MDSLIFNETLNRVQKLKEEKLHLTQNLDTIQNTIAEVQSVISSLKMKGDDIDVFSPRNRESLNRSKLMESQDLLEDLENQKHSLFVSIDQIDAEIVRFTEMLELESEQNDDALLVKKYISAYHQQTLSISKRMELIDSGESVSREESNKEIENLIKVCSQVILQDPMAAKGYLDKIIELFHNSKNLKPVVLSSTDDIYKYFPCFDKASFQKAVYDLPSFSQKVIQSNLLIQKHTALFYMVIYNFLYDVFEKLVSRSVADKIHFSCEEKNKNIEIHLSYIENTYPENYEFLYELDNFSEFVHILTGSENIKWDNNLIKEIYFSIPVPDGLSL